MARDLVTVGRFDIPAKAHIARNALESAGIRSVLQDEQLVAMDYLLNLAVGGIKLQVWEEDAERAVAVLEGRARADGEGTGADVGELGPEGESTTLGVPESVESDTTRQTVDNARDQYAQWAMWSTLCSVLIAPVVLYTNYLLLMAMFSEGKLTGARRWGVWVAALVTPVMIFVSLVWLAALVNLITTGRLDS